MKIAEYKSLTAQLQALLQDIKNLEQPTGSLEREATTPMLVDADIRKTAAMMEALQDDFSEDCKQADHPTIAALASTIAEYLEKTITKYYIPTTERREEDQPGAGFEDQPKRVQHYHRFDIVRTRCEEWRGWIMKEAGRPAKEAERAFNESLDKWVIPLNWLTKANAVEVANSERYKDAVKNGKIIHPFKWAGTKAELIRWVVYELKPQERRTKKGIATDWRYWDGLFESDGKRLTKRDLQKLKSDSV